MFLVDACFIIAYVCHCMHYSNKVNEFSPSTNSFLSFTLCHENWREYIFFNRGETQAKKLQPFFSGWFNQAISVSYSQFLNFSILIALVLTSAGFLMPLVCFHCETSVVSKISATQLAITTCWLRVEPDRNRN